MAGGAIYEVVAEQSAGSEWCGEPSVGSQRGSGPETGDDVVRWTPTGLEYR